MYIKNYEELLNFIIEDDGSVDINDIRFSDNIFNYQLHFVGESWNGNVDIKIADIVKSINEQFIYLYSLANDKTIAESKKIINNMAVTQVYVEDGSSIMGFVKENLEEFIKAIIEGFRAMPDEYKYKIYRILAIGGIVGLVTYSIATKYLDDQHQESLLSLMDTYNQNHLSSIEDIIDKVQKPNLVIAKSLDEGDTIQVFETNEILTKQEAMQRFKSNRESIIETFHVDDLYTVLDIKVNEENPEEKIGVISSENGNKATVKLHVTTSELEQLWTSLKNYTTIRLLVNMDFKNKKIYKGSVVGVGLPREDAKTIREVLDMYTNN